MNLTTDRFSFKYHIENGEYEKRVWYWPFKWYVEPYALGVGEWGESDKFFKKNYPVQFFFRERVCSFFRRHVWYNYKELKYDIKGKLRNPRKEMRDTLFPHRWQDLTETIVEFHLQAVIEMVDREKCFECINYDSDDEHKEFAKGLKECYDYAKTGRKALQLKLEKAFENTPENLPYAETYKEVNEIEAEIAMYDTKVCEWVIKHRHFFWV